MPDEQMVNATRADVDDAVFGAAETVAGEMGLPRRERLKLTLEIANAVMFGIDQLSDAAKRSAAGRKAAEARHSKPKTNVPTPGPAIPTPPFQATKESLATVAQATHVEQGVLQGIPPPPHPLLAPLPPGATPTPFGAPPQ